MKTVATKRSGKSRRTTMLLTCLALSGLVLRPLRLSAEAKPERVIRLAEIEIDPSQVEQYKAALRQEIEISIKNEPGVFTLYAVSVRNHPEPISLFGVYADQAAYQSHLRSPHFLKYKGETQSMVRSLKLVETDPVFLGSK